MDLAMSNLLKDIYNKAESIKGRKLIYTILVIFVVFTIIGISIGYIISPKLNSDENSGPVEYYGGNDGDVATVEAEGRITYVNPEFYPMDDVSYSLNDYSGKELYLLKSNDEKLSIAEGLFAKVVGKMGKLNDGQTDVLIVEEVIINSAAD
jgi:hypothetical protein